MTKWIKPENSKTVLKRKGEYQRFMVNKTGNVFHVKLDYDGSAYIYFASPEEFSVEVEQTKEELASQIGC